MSDPDFILEVSHLKKTYKRRGRHQSEVRAVDDVSFNVNRNESFGIIGESGSGKSTLGRLILRLIESTDGVIRFDGHPITKLSQKSMYPFRQQMQIVFQNSGGAFNPRKTIGEQIAFPMRQFNLCPPNEMVDRVVSLLERVGLRADHLHRYPHEFSGGQRQRIGIARALATNPEFIVLDEPTSALDVSIQAQILNLLQDIKEDTGITMIMITHNLGIAKYFCDRIAVMSQGRLVEIGASDDVFHHPKHDVTRELVTSILEA